MLPSPEDMQKIESTSLVAQIIEHEYNPPEIMETRKNTCFSCAFYLANSMTCSECNCPVIMMAQFNFKQCPKGYWI